MRYRASASHALAAVAVVLTFQAAAAQSIYLEYVGSPGRVGPPVTPDCSSWHELYPSHCVVHHQDAYADDGDGFISACDHIVLDGVSCHVDWVGPTYYLESMNADRQSRYVEPTGVSAGRDPTCETWHEIYPDHCLAHHVDAWEDNGDGLLGPCDVIYFAGEPWHLVGVGLNIAVTPDSPVEPGTWGQLKELFRTLFD